MNRLEFSADFFPRDRIEARNVERQLVVEILFYIFYSVQMKLPIAKAFIDVIADCAARVGPAVHEVDQRLFYVRNNLIVVDIIGWLCADIDSCWSYGAYTYYNQSPHR